MTEEDAPSFLPVARVAARKGPPGQDIFQARSRKPKNPRLAKQQEVAHPLRDKVLACLTEPRSSGEIAEWIERPRSDVASLLSGLCRRGLVRRLSFNTYVRPGYRGPRITLEVRHAKVPKALLERVGRQLRGRKSVAELCALTGETEETVRAALHELWFDGFSVGNDEIGYRLKKSARRR